MNSDDENSKYIDPDYVRNNTTLKEKENKTSEKLSKVLSEVFDEELRTRQNQLEETEEIIAKAQKLLHVLRYSLVTSYYNKNNSVITTNEENSTTNFDKQNRIHPALKKLLGKNAQLGVFTSGKRKIASKICHSEEASTSQESNTKKIKLENKIASTKKHSVDKNQNLRNRAKTQQRLIIGNISKWMPSSEKDNTTHKWMMYVRGEKENPDISHIVEKVIFYLHPSYKPHDVVQVRESPFHLSRRGWGEFPLRVQIFFKCTLNKSISIVHNLKLDKTYTGRQTLGNETVVEVYLHSDKALPIPVDEPIINSQIKNEEESIDTKPLFSFDFPSAQCTSLESDYLPLDFNKSESAVAETCNFFERSDSTFTTDSAYGPSDSASASYEHDYCQDGDISEEQFIDNEMEARHDGFLKYLQFEHSYSLPDISENTNHRCGSSEKFDTNSDDLDKIKLVCDDTNLNGEIRNSSHSSRILLTNGHSDIESVKSPECSLKSLTSTSLYESRYKVTLPKNEFKSIGEALPFLLKRFPLWNELAEREEYRTIYPFVATSQKEFEKWNIGKQLNSEWNRAKEVKKILLERFPIAKNWNTKAFLMYARTHGYYCPLKNIANFFETESKELALIDNCFMEPLCTKVYTGKRDDKVASRDIVSNGDASLSSSHNTPIDISDTTLKNHCTFVRETALDCRIVLKSEEIEDGVVMNSAERTILEAVKCLAEGLIRRSKHHSVTRNNRFSRTSDITKNEVEKALNERSELRSIIQFQRKKREIDFLHDENIRLY